MDLARQIITERERTMRPPLTREAQQDLYELLKKHGRGCPNDTDGDGNCRECAWTPLAHWARGLLFDEGELLR